MSERLNRGLGEENEGAASGLLRFVEPLGDERSYIAKKADGDSGDIIGDSDADGTDTLEIDGTDEADTDGTDTLGGDDDGSDATEDKGDSDGTDGESDGDGEDGTDGDRVDR
ncbi:MAG TPA: hypothetical protein VF507_06320 [Pyrinomonadaceae bacterium]|jgi:hypothetical protein